MSEEEISTVIKEYDKIQMVSQIHKYVGFLRLNSIHFKIGPANDLKFARAVMENSVNDDFDAEVSIVYSPLHGTGSVPVPHILKERGYKNVFKVKDQMDAKNGFSTIDAADVDEPSVYAMAIDLADEKGSDIVMVTDTDCANAGIAVRDDEGVFVILTQEQKDALIDNYLKENGVSGERPHDGVYECMIMAEIAGVYRKAGRKMFEEQQ